MLAGQLRNRHAIWLKNPSNFHFSAIMPRGYSSPVLDVSSLQIDTWAAASAYNAQLAAAQAGIGCVAPVDHLLEWKRDSEQRGVLPQ